MALLVPKLYRFFFVPLALFFLTSSCTCRKEVKLLGMALLRLDIVYCQQCKSVSAKLLGMALLVPEVYRLFFAPPALSFLHIFLTCSKEVTLLGMALLVRKLYRLFLVPQAFFLAAFFSHLSQRGTGSFVFGLGFQMLSFFAPHFAQTGC